MKTTTLKLTGKLPLLLGALMLGISCLAVSLPQAEAQQVAQTDDVEKRNPGLDPWNVQIRKGPQWDPKKAPPAVQMRAKRHLEYLQAGVPLEYRSQRSPYPNVPKAIDAGRVVYESNCVACHGARGRGDGDAGVDLLPSPALLSELMDQQGKVDEYLLWSVSEGGAQFGTAMPAFKSRLTENQIWQAIAYMRAGFPPAN